VEGQGTSDWTLIDLGAVVVHVMMPQARTFYDLEGLWQGQSQSIAARADRKNGVV
jgi:ribosome-associated protein